MGNRGLSEISAVGEFGEFGNAGVREFQEVGNFGISGFREARNLWKFRNSGNSETFGNFRNLRSWEGGELGSAEVGMFGKTWFGNTESLGSRGS